MAVLMLSYFLSGDALKEGKKIASYIQIQLFRANRKMRSPSVLQRVNLKVEQEITI